MGDVMNYHELRRAFSKCGILIAGDGISLVFPQYDDPQFITISVDDDEFDNKRVFENLLNACNYLRISLCPGRYVRLGFMMGLPVESELYYPPLKKELSCEELHEIVKMGNYTPDHDFLEIFGDVDLATDDSVLAGLSEYLDRKSSGGILSIAGVRKWPEVYAAAKRFSEKTEFGVVSVESPDQYIDFGTVSFDIELDHQVLIDIANESMPDFIQMIRTANWVSLDGFSSDEKAEFILSVHS